MTVRTKQNRLEEPTKDQPASDGPAVDAQTSAARLLAGLMRGELSFGSVLGIEAPDYQRMINKGEAYLSMGKPDRARRIFEGITALEPDVAAFYLPLGMACEACGDLDAAFIAYTEAIHMTVDSSDPTLCGAYLGRGQVRYRNGDTDGALTDIVLARDYDVDNQLLDTIDAMTQRWAERHSTERES